MRSYPDFSDGLLHGFVVDLPEGDGVKLALVQVGHGPVSRLLTQTLGRFQGVLKIVPATRLKKVIQSNRDWTQSLASTKNQRAAAVPVLAVEVDSQLHL